MELSRLRRQTGDLTLQLETYQREIQNLKTLNHDMFVKQTHIVSSAVRNVSISWQAADAESVESRFDQAERAMMESVMKVGDGGQQISSHIQLDLTMLKRDVIAILHQMEEEALSLSQQCGSLGQRVASAEDKVQESSKLLENHKAEIIALRAENNELRHSIESKEGVLLSANAEVKKLQDERLRLRESHETEKNALQQDLLKWKTEAESVRESLHTRVCALETAHANEIQKLMQQQVQEESRSVPINTPRRPASMVDVGDIAPGFTSESTSLSVRDHNWLPIAMIVHVQECMQDGFCVIDFCLLPPIYLTLCLLSQGENAGCRSSSL